MQNVSRDPKYANNALKFFGVEEEPKGKKTTYAERLKSFINS